MLVVDDDPEIRESVADLLREEGYGVEVVENGQAALEWLSTTIKLPCVIVLDLMMPVMSGEEFRVRQLNDARLASVPVVVMSASYQVAKLAALMRADAVVTKPTRGDSLIHEIDRLCTNRAR